MLILDLDFACSHGKVVCGNGTIVFSYSNGLFGHDKIIVCMVKLYSVMIMVY